MKRRNGCFWPLADITRCSPEYLPLGMKQTRQLARVHALGRPFAWFAPGIIIRRNDRCLLFSRCASAHIDRGSIQPALDMAGIVFLDHLHTRPAIPGQLQDIRAFQQAERDVGVAQAVKGPQPPLAIMLKP